MKIALWVTFAAVWLAILWWLVFHPLLHRWGIAHNLFELLDAREAGTGARLRVALSGLKRIMFTRLIWINSLMVLIHDYALVNTGMIEPMIPAEYRVYLMPTIFLIGLINEILNKISQQPVGEISPVVLAEATKQPLETVVAATVNEPAVGVPTQQQIMQA